MGAWLNDLSKRELLRKVRQRVLPNLQHIPKSKVKICGACQQRTLVLALGEEEEFHVCLRCRANLRYEMLARHLRKSFPQLSSIDVLELDPSSPLRSYLSGARTYTRSFYRDNIKPGTVREDGAVCQDITRLTFPDNSLDLIVSSDVLEHVPDPAAAFRETARVLRPNGTHVFTVPPRPQTRRRAMIEAGQIKHLVSPPEYHRDPLDPAGILVFWDYGPDMPSVFQMENLKIQVVAGPEGRSGRVVWEARRI